MRKILFFILLCPFFTHAQSWQWAQTSAGTEAQGAAGCATDKFGNIYMAGYSYLNLSSDTGNSIFFGTLAITGTDDFYNYLVKYNSSGTPVWLKKLPFSGDLHVATDSTGNVFLAGNYNSSFTLGAYTVTSVGTSSNIYLAKLDSSGTVLWLRASTSQADAGGTAFAITTDNAGNAIVGGIISDSVSFGPATLTAHDLFVVKYDKDGNVKWATAMGGHPRHDSISSGILFPELIMSIAIDHQGNIVLAGEYLTDTFVAGAYQLANRSAGGTNSFLIKCDTAGTVLWANPIGGATSMIGAVGDYAYSTAIDAAGSIYLAGVTNSDTLYIGDSAFANTCTCNDLLFAKYNAAGVFEWRKPSAFTGGTPATNGLLNLGVAAYSCSSVYIMGLATDTVNFGPFTLPPTYYIVKFDTAGTPLSAASAGNLNYFIPRTIVAGTGDNAYVAGAYYSDCSVGDNELTITGASNAFLAKYGLSASTAVAQVEANKEWSLFPNPATNEVNISAAASLGPIMICNILGQTVYAHTYAGHEAKIDVLGLGSGVYFVRVDGVGVGEFVKR